MDISKLEVGKIDLLTDYISMNQIPSSWINCFNEIKQTYFPTWLNKYNFYEILSYYEFDDNFIKRFYMEIQSLKEDRILNFICYIMYYILFKACEKDYTNIWSWKSSYDLFKKHGSYMIPVVSLLCGNEFHINNMMKRNFDKEQISIQKYNILLACTNDRKRHNIDGIRFSQMIWGSFFMKGYLVQLGRLQYEIGVKKFSNLDKYFKEKNEYIYIHIPRGNDLNKKDVDESLKNIREYINLHFKEYRNKKLIFYTKTWLLSKELKEFLPSSSNIIKFQERFNIIEYEECNDDFLNFVFDDFLGNIDYNYLKENTKLQKELKRMLVDGRKLHLGLGILKEGINNE